MANSSASPCFKPSVFIYNFGFPFLFNFGDAHSSRLASPSCCLITGCITFL